MRERIMINSVANSSYTLYQYQNKQKINFQGNASISSNIPFYKAKLVDIFTSYQEFAINNKKDSFLANLSFDALNTLNDKSYNTTFKVISSALKINDAIDNWTKLEKFLILFLDDDFNFNKAFISLSDYMKLNPQKKLERIIELQKERKIVVNSSQEEKLKTTTIKKSLNFDYKFVEDAKKQYLSKLKLSKDIRLTQIYNNPFLLSDIINNISNNTNSSYLFKFAGFTKSKIIEFKIKEKIINNEEIPKDFSTSINKYIKNKEFLNDGTTMHSSSPTLNTLKYKNEHLLSFTARPANNFEKRTLGEINITDMYKLIFQYTKKKYPKSPLAKIQERDAMELQRIFLKKFFEIENPKVTPSRSSISDQVNKDIHLNLTILGINENFSNTLMDLLKYLKSKEKKKDSLSWYLTKAKTLDGTEPKVTSTELIQAGINKESQMISKIAFSRAKVGNIVLSRLLEKINEVQSEKPFKEVLLKEALEEPEILQKIVDNFIKVLRGSPYAQQFEKIYTDLKKLEFPPKDKDGQIKIAEEAAQILNKGLKKIELDKESIQSDTAFNLSTNSKCDLCEEIA